MQNTMHACAGDRASARVRKKSTKEYSEPIVFVGGKKHKEPKEKTVEEEEFDWTCPHCGVDLEY